MVALPTHIETHDVTVTCPPDLLALKGRGSGRARCFEFSVRAAALGHTTEDCPYGPGQGTGQFRKAWMRGYEAYHRVKQRRIES